LITGRPRRTCTGFGNNIGELDNQYFKRQTDQARVAATGSADIGQHAVSVGIEYEQISDRRYNMAPVGLWTRARQLTTSHIEELDKSDSTVTYFFGTLPFITYQRLHGDDQTFFDRSLRTALGLDSRRYRLPRCGRLGSLGVLPGHVQCGRAAQRQGTTWPPSTAMITSATR
jgi:hypothetical protein